ncbi:uncharacterized protein LOC112170570 [Rosa chinensis]|uniref:uncharacterized protein LOC112170570 n=1 Tax=Rosa chinensis TaxID=74649 RepID=UPI000D090941|nr:uncharacterized protein LOC112170570 [Rosa chinensis]
MPEVLVLDRRAAFMGGDVEQLVNDFSIQFLHSTPYYAQSNGQAEASNKIIITLLKKMLVENPRQLHETLYERCGPIVHEDLSGQRLEDLDNLVMEKQSVARTYDKRTCGRSYKEGELIWKAFLPFGEKLTGRGKWTPRWEGPFVIHRILECGAFHLRDLDGDLHRNPINGKFLKKYYPSVWEFED